VKIIVALTVFIILSTFTLSYAGKFQMMPGYVLLKMPVPFSDIRKIKGMLKGRVVSVGSGVTIVKRNDFVMFKKQPLSSMRSDNKALIIIKQADILCTVEQ